MKKNKALKLSLLAILLGLLIACILIAVTGTNPINLFIALIRSISGFYIKNPSEGISLRYPLNWLLASLPLVLTGLSVGFANRTGMFNIGGEGQYIVGSLAASAVALLVKLPPVIHPIACILAAFVAGAIWGFLPGFLKAVRNINEVVICVMLNYIALYFSKWAINKFLPVDANTRVRTIAFPESASLGKVSFGTTSQFHWGFILIIICVIAYWFIIEKTTFGYSLRATGFNKEGARYAGMKTKLNATLSMMIAGGLSGMAGAIVTMGVFNYGKIFTAFSGYGFDGISVALAGAGDAVGILLSGLLFGLLDSAGTTLQLLGIPKEIASIIKACVLVFIAIQYGFIKIGEWLRKRKEAKLDGSNN